MVAVALFSPRGTVARARHFLVQGEEAAFRRGVRGDYPGGTDDCLLVDYQDRRDDSCVRHCVDLSYRHAGDIHSLCCRYHLLYEPVWTTFPPRLGGERDLRLLRRRVLHDRIAAI